MKVKLKNAGTNPIQRPYTWLVGPDSEEGFPLEIGETFHIEGQPDDVLWMVESIDDGHDD
jgi:hypothetical protein